MRPRSSSLLAVSLLASALTVVPAGHTAPVSHVASAPAQVVQEYDYQPERVYTVRTALGITTQIELSPHENVLDYSTGFSSGWDLSRRGNVFYLRPKNVDVDTNLVVRTETHSYLFELKVVATGWRVLDEAKQAGVHYKVKFAYPGDAKFTARKDMAEAEPAPEFSLALDPARTYRFDYEYAARPRQAWLVPANVYDDGRFTYLRLARPERFPTGDFPAVFARDRERGEEFVVNTTVRGDTIVVHGTYPYLVVRHGRDAVGLRRRQSR